MDVFSEDPLLRCLSHYSVTFLTALRLGLSCCSKYGVLLNHNYC